MFCFLVLLHFRLFAGLWWVKRAGTVLETQHVIGHESLSNVSRVVDDLGPRDDRLRIQSRYDAVLRIVTYIKISIHSLAGFNLQPTKE